MKSKSGAYKAIKPRLSKIRASVLQLSLKKQEAIKGGNGDSGGPMTFGG